ncbi:hypothetical protein BJ508DRAFT_78256 [Ascobolus immersus RN42]|uniref:Uncharacterized protein n=1 Tax=Ascobolus immersus RN42 TaxID=1160509 RepID=A0A3N4INA2_ASCIM|nr:hypothetical protein BJ508DRAFT_78256 [Ascobolus immersus RN42]
MPLCGMRISIRRGCVLFDSERKKEREREKKAEYLIVVPALLWLTYMQNLGRLREKADRQLGILILFQLLSSPRHLMHRVLSGLWLRFVGELCREPLDGKTTSGPSEDRPCRKLPEQIRSRAMAAKFPISTTFNDFLSTNQRWDSLGLVVAVATILASILMAR